MGNHDVWEDDRREWLRSPEYAALLPILQAIDTLRGELFAMPVAQMTLRDMDYIRECPTLMPADEDTQFYTQRRLDRLRAIMHRCTHP